MDKQLIKRLAELNYQINTSELSDELNYERKFISNYMIDSGITEVDSEYGFHFIGKNAKINSKIYLEAYDNFKNK
jgi:hypothetical protein